MHPSDPRKRSKPESLRLRGLVPSLTVKDLHASVAWYRDVVGFHVQEAHDWEGEVRGYTLVAGTQRILINQDDFAKGQRVKGQGLRMYLETSQDVDRVAADIKARGGTLASEPEDQPWGPRAFNLVDPDGFLFTVMSGS
jgi:uncharacterized glyoxalase superfamily protein PhnB